MAVCTNRGHGHHQGQNHHGKSSASDREEPEQLGHVRSGSGVKAKDVYEDGVGSPVNYHESAGKMIIRLNAQVNGRPTI